MLLAEDCVRVLKTSEVTRLAEGLDKTGEISAEACKRTLDALLSFYDKAKEFGADEVYAYATEAMRKCKNPELLKDAFREKTGVDIEIISGEKEAELGLEGALKGKDGCVIDLGGASIELTVAKNGKTVYSKSLPVGIVRVKDYMNSGKGDVKDYIESVLDGFSDAPRADLYVLTGGTATHLASIDLKLPVYDPDKVNGHEFSYGRICELCELLSTLTAEETALLPGATRERADTVYGGTLVLKTLFEKSKIERAVVSEDDNLDGFLRYLTEENSHNEFEN